MGFSNMHKKVGNSRSIPREALKQYRLHAIATDRSNSPNCQLLYSRELNNMVKNLGLSLY